MAGRLQGKRIAVLVANEGVERVEMIQPIKAAKDEGAEIEVVSPEVGKVQTMDHLDKASVLESDRSVADASTEHYDGMILPGGVANPDALRLDRNAVDFTKQMWASGKPIAAICHAPWILVEADVVRGRTLTSWPSLQTDIRNAGGIWVDQEVCTDAGLVTSRKPDDLTAFCAKMVEEFREGNHTDRR